MAIKHVATTAGKRSVEGDMTVEEFKEWLSRFDVNNDGRISREELRQAISSINVRFSGWKSGRGLRYADTDGDGYIDAGEVDNLVEFARRLTSTRHLRRRRRPATSSTSASTSRLAGSLLRRDGDGVFAVRDRCLDCALQFFHRAAVRRGGRRDGHRGGREEAAVGRRCPHRRWGRHLSFLPSPPLPLRRRLGLTVPVGVPREGARPPSQVVLAVPPLPLLLPRSEEEQELHQVRVLPQKPNHVEPLPLPLRRRRRSRLRAILLVALPQLPEAEEGSQSRRRLRRSSLLLGGDLAGVEVVEVAVAVGVPEGEPEVFQGDIRIPRRAAGMGEEVEG